MVYLKTSQKTSNNNNNNNNKSARLKPNQAPRSRYVRLSSSDADDEDEAYMLDGSNSTDDMEAFLNGDFDSLSHSQYFPKERGSASRDNQEKNDFPQHWSRMDNSKNLVEVVGVVLEPNSDEYINVAVRFHEHLLFPAADITRIVRIQNPYLWKSYSLKKEQMVQENDKMAVKEYQLFHGTKCNTVEAIVRRGFDWRFCGKHGTAYGHGCYFAGDSFYSNTYTDRGNAPSSGNDFLKSIIQVSTAAAPPSSSSSSGSGHLPVPTPQPPPRPLPHSAPPHAHRALPTIMTPVVTPSKSALKKILPFLKTGCNPLLAQLLKQHTQKEMARIQAGGGGAGTSSSQPPGGSSAGLGGAQASSAGLGAGSTQPSVLVGGQGQSQSQSGGALAPPPPSVHPGLLGGSSRPQPAHSQPPPPFQPSSSSSFPQTQPAVQYRWNRYSLLAGGPPAKRQQQQSSTPVQSPQQASSSSSSSSSSQRPVLAHGLHPNQLQANTNNAGKTPGFGASGKPAFAGPSAGGKKYVARMSVFNAGGTTPTVHSKGAAGGQGQQQQSSAGMGGLGALMVPMSGGGSGYPPVGSLSVSAAPGGGGGVTLSNNNNGSGGGSNSQQRLALMIASNPASAGASLSNHNPGSASSAVTAVSNYLLLGHLPASLPATPASLLQAPPPSSLPPPPPHQPLMVNHSAHLAASPWHSAAAAASLAPPPQGPPAPGQVGGQALDLRKCGSSAPRYLFLAKVLAGRATGGQPEFRRPPPLDDMDPLGRCYDSCVDNIYHPRIWVIFDSTQAYPEYAIEYIVNGEMYR